MGSRKGSHRHGKSRKKHAGSHTPTGSPAASAPAAGKRLEIVLKCDTAGCAEAIMGAVESMQLPAVEVSVLRSGIGPVNVSDIFMAETGSRLIVGFNVGLMPRVETLAVEQGVEIRLFEVIYRLLEDLETIGKSLTPREPLEEITGSARVIALFKSCRGGIILGCEVKSGRLRLGDSFRVVGAMGNKYAGRIESLHIERDAVKEAVKGQQAGLKIRDFNRAVAGDLVESFHPAAVRQAKPWQPRGGIFYPNSRFAAH